MLRLILPALVAWTALSAAQGQVYYFSGAICIVPAGISPSAAVSAQCPADHPVSCVNIQEPFYCCPANNYCSWVNNVVACCPSDQTCTGSIWQSVTTTWQPTSTYYAQPTTTVVVVPAAVTTTQFTTQQPHETTTAYYGQYCSTLVAVGPNLPTTAAGQCGTILVVPPSEASRQLLDTAQASLIMIGFHVLSGFVFRFG